MGFERSEWRGHKRPVPGGDTTRQRKYDLLAAHRAALSTAQVTGDEHWDLFLSVINAKIEGVQKQLSDVEVALRDGDDFTPETLINQKLAVRLLGRELEAYRWVIGLPKSLMEQGDRARQIAEELDTTEPSTH